MKWITWQQIGIDRMACIWLIQRFIDSEASFEFITEEQTPNQDQGQAFDIPQTRFSHRFGHSSFHTFLEEYQLTDSTLRRIARIIDEADEIQEINLEPIATGLEVICRGIRRISQNDHEAMKQSHFIFEALYAELRRKS